MKHLITFILFIHIGLYCIGQSCPSPWQTTNTGDDHTLVITASAALFLNGAPLDTGTYIGVFFVDQNGQEQCGGYGKWTGASFTIPIYGDDATTPQKDGFAPNENFRFRFYDDLNTAIKLNPNDAIINYNMGQLFAVYTDRLDSAILYFEKALELSPQSPNNGEIYMNLAAVRHRTGNLEKALAEFEKAEVFLPENDLLLYNYAMSLSDVGSNKDALLKISKAIDINPNDAEYFNLKGTIFLELSSFIEAKAEFKNAVRLNPKYGGAYYNLGYLFGELNDHTQSIKYYDHAVNLNFELESTLVNRALQKMKINRTTDACEDLKRVYKLGRTDIKPLMERNCN